MSLSVAFQERLQQMDRARIHRLSLLEAEKEVQASKSKLLESKLERVGLTERRCLFLEQKIASMNFNVSTLNFQIQRLDAKYSREIQELRGLKGEVEELEKVEKEKDEYHESKTGEMREFMEKAEKFAAEWRRRVEELRNTVTESQSRFMNLQGNFEYTSNTEIADAEMRKSELLAIKENLDRDLDSNYQIKLQLQRQLHDKFSTQKKEK